MGKTCSICQKEMREPSVEMHTCEEDGLGGAHVMGAWAEGWLKEIIKDPARYR